MNSKKLLDIAVDVVRSEEVGRHILPAVLALGLAGPGRVSVHRVSSVKMPQLVRLIQPHCEAVLSAFPVVSDGDEPMAEEQGFAFVSASDAWFLPGSYISGAGRWVWGELVERANHIRRLTV